MYYLGLRHKHERTAAHKKEKKTRYIALLDKFTLIVGIVGPFTVVPQIYSIFSTQSAVGVSFSTWLLMFLVMLPWVWYGLAHKDMSITISFILWAIANLLVVIGVLLYG